MSSPPLLKLAPADDADQARRRLARSSFRPRFFPQRRRQPPGDVSITHIDVPEPHDPQPIVLSDPLPASDDDYQDKFAWAVLYENQRGLTLFSTRYYSHRSLLPMDPAPFTLPSPSFSRSKQPFKSLDDYQFPDGTWRWVSKSWMVDMRSNSGEIQYDGFEYNWFFRRCHWRAVVGPLSAGGWVRRRRWIRLMMRPAKRTSDTVISNSVGPSVNADNVWEGEALEDCWNHCRTLMKQLDLDGRKLEVWLSWMEAPTTRTRELIMKVLERHIEQILDMFIYPDSRAQFLTATERMGASVRTERGVEFWSYHG